MGAGKRNAPTPAKAPAAPPAQPVPPPPSEPAAEPWEFDALPAPVSAHGDVQDELARTVLQQLGLKLDGNAQLTTSAHANSTGGVTLRLADPRDAKAACELYATRSGNELAFTDSRCSFPILQGDMHTTATCRKVSGTAKRVKDRVALDAKSPDCTATLQGVPLQISGTVKPR